MGKIPGVYKILNKKTHQFYIGSSNNIKRRFMQHRYKGIHGKYKNNKLYKDMFEMGIDNFEFILLEETNDYREREQFYIDELKPYYNTSDKAKNSMDDEFTKEKHQKSTRSAEYIEKIKATRSFTKTEDFRNNVSVRSKKWWKENYEKGCEKNRKSQSSVEYREKRSKMAQAYKELNRLHQPNRIGVVMLDENKKVEKEFLSLIQASEYLKENGFPKATPVGVKQGAINNGFRYNHYWQIKKG